MTDYLSRVEHAIRTGYPIPHPQTVSDWQALSDTYPERASPLLPSPNECRRLGLRVDVKPMPQEWRERMLLTLAEDRDFARAFAHLIGGAR